jgi:hypothetical protein
MARARSRSPRRLPNPVRLDARTAQRFIAAAIPPGNRHSGRAGHRFDSRMALCATAMCFAAAILPTAILCVFLRWTTCLSPHFGHALYLITPPLIAVFVASHMRRTRSEERKEQK